MIDYLVNDNFDVVLPLQKVTDKSDLLFQQVRLILNTWTNDFPYDITAGIPYDESILGTSNVDASDIEIIYYQKISKLVYFKNLENFSISRNSNRELIISFEVFAVNGDSQTFTMVV